MAEPRLSMAARAFRGLHGLNAVVFLLAIVDVWRCALTGRRGRWPRAALAALVTEGLFVTANRGNCLFSGLPDRRGRPGAVVRARALALRGPPRPVSDITGVQQSDELRAALLRQTEHSPDRRLRLRRLSTALP
jgi:hypothetical protein